MTKAVKDITDVAYQCKLDPSITVTFDVLSRFVAHTYDNTTVIDTPHGLRIVMKDGEKKASFTMHSDVRKSHGHEVEMAYAALVDVYDNASVGTSLKSIEAQVKQIVHTQLEQGEADMSRKNKKRHNTNITKNAMRKERKAAVALAKDRAPQLADTYAGYNLHRDRAGPSNHNGVKPTNKPVSPVAPVVTPLTNTKWVPPSQTTYVRPAPEARELSVHKIKYTDMSAVTAHELKNVRLLQDMLSFMRPHGTKVERNWVEKYIVEALKHDGFAPFYDKFDNVHLDIKHEDGTEAEIMWSSHTDTVHNNQGEQTVIYRPHHQTFALPQDSKSNCLGADDTTGVWIMLAMIRAKVPGHYIFHYGEERGGIGSGKLSRYWEKEKLEHGFKYAIAFDRMGYGDVITSQGGTTASDEFAKLLATFLPEHYSPCSGVFTDTANYAELIAECTNLSVGYYFQHTHHEVQHVPTALRLVRALTKPSVVNGDFHRALVATRKPGPRYRSYTPTTRYTGPQRGWEGYGFEDYYGDWGSYYGNDTDDKKPVTVAQPASVVTTPTEPVTPPTDLNRDRPMGDYIFQHASGVGAVMTTLGITHAEAATYILNAFKSKSLGTLASEYPDEVGEMLIEMGVSLEQLKLAVAAAKA